MMKIVIALAVLAFGLYMLWGALWGNLARDAVRANERLRRLLPIFYPYLLASKRKRAEPLNPRFYKAMYIVVSLMFIIGGIAMLISPELLGATGEWSAP